mmetsp:Transcript_62790/g.141825  ORF Transcript_62790/g.141825 Transcript_62790/m.141825 type:complete len:244 (-) Transcript_62790:506-1237(-)
MAAARAGWPAQRRRASSFMRARTLHGRRPPSARLPPRQSRSRQPAQGDSTPLSSMGHRGFRACTEVPTIPPVEATPPTLGRWRRQPTRPRQCCPLAGLQPRQPAHRRSWHRSQCVLLHLIHHGCTAWTPHWRRHLRRSRHSRPLAAPWKTRHCSRPRLAVRPRVCSLELRRPPSLESTRSSGTCPRALRPLRQRCCSSHALACSMPSSCRQVQLMVLGMPAQLLRWPRPGSGGVPAAFLPLRR